MSGLETEPLLSKQEGRKRPKCRALLQMVMSSEADRSQFGIEVTSSIILPVEALVILITCRYLMPPAQACCPY